MATQNSILKRYSLSLNRRRFIIAIVFFIASISFVSSLGINNIKYIAVFITVVMAFNPNANKIKMMITIPVISILVISTVLQPISSSQKLLSIAFYVVLLHWIMEGGRILRSPKDYLSVSIGIMLAIAIGLILTRGEIAGQLANPWNTRRRIWAGFGHANTLGSMAVTGMFSEIIYFRLMFGNEYKRKQNVLLIIMVTFFMIVLYITKSRTSIIMLFSFLIVQVIYNVSKLSRRKKIAISIVLIPILSYIAWVFIDSYILNDQAYLIRLLGLRNLSFTPTTFLIGHGMIGTADITYSFEGGLEIAWVMLFYKTGVAGIICYIILIAFLCFQERNNYIKGRIDSKKHQLYMSILISMLVGSFAESYIVSITHIVAMFEWICLGALSSPNKKTYREKHEY